MKQMTEAVIVDAVRTPVGKREGIYNEVRADTLGAACVKALVERSRLDPAEIEDVIFGCVTQAGEQGMNVGRMIALVAGLPETVPGMTVNRFCGSGLQAIHDAAHAIQAGVGDLYIAGGVEHMTHLPMGGENPNPHPEVIMKYPFWSMGMIGESMAEQYNFSREELDRFSLESQRRAVRALQEGYLKQQIVPIEVPTPDGKTRLVDSDEPPRADTSLEKMASLKPSFDQESGKLTAGNSSPITDGAAAVLVASAEKAKALGLKPMASIRATAVVGVHPGTLIGPVPATKKVLQRAGLKLSDIDVIELNEAFASVVLASIRELGIDPERLNPNGGAIALGHPLGCSGARLVTACVHELKRRNRRYGLVTLCIGFGQGIACIVERKS